MRLAFGEMLKWSIDGVQLQYALIAEIVETRSQFRRLQKLATRWLRRSYTQTFDKPDEPAYREFLIRSVAVQYGCP